MTGRRRMKAKIASSTVLVIVLVFSYPALRRVGEVLAHGKPEAGRGLREGVARTTGEPQEAFREAPGWLWEDLGIASWRHGTIPGAIGQLQVAHGPYGLTFSSVWGAHAHMSLRFQMFWGPRTLSPYACAAKSPRPRKGHPPPDGFFCRFFALGGEP